MSTVNERLEQYFRSLGADLADAATMRLPPESLELSLDTAEGDRRTISLPVEDADIEALISVAAPAHFGAGEDTVYDPSVRDTWVIDPAHVHLGGQTWENHLGEALETLGRTLGIGDGARVRAELHSMLVYGEGQFFLPHQDSEKDDSMLASLVISLPTAHTGGELIVDDGGVERVFRGDANDITLVAFYADRRHEVRPVTSGHRITLTFNLLVEAEPSSEPSADVDLVTLLREYFATPVEPKYGNGRAEVPQRLVLLLDHEYSQNGLSLGGLKGRDALWASRLLSVAEASDHEAMLGLAEIHEIRDAAIEDSYDDDNRRRGGWDFGWDDEFEDGFADDVAVGSDLEADGYLIDGSIALGWWVDPHTGAGETIESIIDEEESLAVTPTRQLRAHSAEFEGYMGNYGNTVDHWYRRAAIIVWPRSASFAVRAEAGPQWALQTLGERIAEGDIASAAADARSLEPFWSGGGPATLGQALDVAGGVDDPRAAMVVLKPYGIAEVATEHASAIASLTSQYGQTWLSKFLESWAARSPRLVPSGDLDWREWVRNRLVPVVSGLRAETGTAGDVAAEVVVAQAATFVEDRVEEAQRQQPPARAWAALEEVGGYAARVLTAADHRQAAKISEKLVAVDGLLVPLLVSILRSAGDPDTVNFYTIVDECRHRLEAEVAKPRRAADDWSIPFTGCGCADCQHLAVFLGSSSQRAETWPLAKARRQHIHGMIDAQGLSVTHTTERTGSPHKLKLRKTDRLMKEDAAGRRYFEAQLAWVTGLRAR